MADTKTTKIKTADEIKIKRKSLTAYLYWDISTEDWPLRFLKLVPHFLQV